MSGPEVQMVGKQQRLARAIVSGFAATAVMLFAFIGAYGIALAVAGVELADRRFAETYRVWFHNLANNPIIDLARDNLYLALALHLFAGLLWAVVYAYYVEPRLSGPGWRRGVVFSIVPWLLSLLVFFPLVGGGFLGFGIGAGPLPMIGNLVLHLVYGATLGLLYGPFGDVVMEGAPHAHYAPYSAEAETQAMQLSEAMAARGIVVGVAVGLAVGLVVALLASAGSSVALVLGISPLAFVVASAILGGALGGLVGSLAGLPSSGQA